MRAVYFNYGNVDLREIEEPADDGQRVHVRSTGICGSDLHMLAMKFPGTFIAGHEIAGVLDDGTPVAVEPAIPCGECEYCRSGDYNLCPHLIVFGIARDGGMADQIRVPKRCLVPLPSNVDVMNACYIEPLAVALHGIGKADLKQGQRVAVVGGGTIGLCAAAIAHTSGAEVGLAARYEHQTKAGSQLGAGLISGQYDLVIESVGTEEAINQAVRLCKSGGKILILGTYWAGVSFPQLSAMLKEITVINSYMYAESNGKRDFDLAASLLSQHPEIADLSITHRFPLSDVQKAFQVAQDRKSGAIKVVLEP